MGRGNSANLLYGAAPARQKITSGEPNPTPEKSPVLPLAANGDFPEGSRVRYLGHRGAAQYDQGIPDNAEGIVQSKDQYTGSYWVRFDGRPIDDVLRPHEIETVTS